MSTLGAEQQVVGGRYSLRRVVGRGGMGVLWAAWDEMLGREVAVKEVRTPVDAAGEHDDVARDRALREARAAARVTHPSAVRVYDVVEEDGRPWIVMELLPPRTLADLLNESGPLAPQVAARIGLDLLDALTAAHAAGVLHRDVKPGNVLFADGRAVLVDFGIAVVDDDATLTASGTLLGSPAFMPPERARGEMPTAASDLWSLGATLFTAVEGDPPFRRDGQLPTLAAVVTQEAPQARHAGPLRSILARLLARDPADRPSAAEVRAELVRALVPDAADLAPSPSPSAPAAAVDGAEDDGDPTVEAAVLDDAASDATLATSAVPARLLPRPRRAGALAAALLTPVTLFALLLGKPMAWPLTGAPEQSGVVAGSTAPARVPSTTAATHRSAPSTATRSVVRARPVASVVSGVDVVAETRREAVKGGRHEHAAPAKGKDKGKGHGGKRADVPKRAPSGGHAKVAKDAKTHDKGGDKGKGR